MYFFLVLKASIISACLSSERDMIKSLSQGIFNNSQEEATMILLKYGWREQTWCNITEHIFIGYRGIDDIHNFQAVYLLCQAAIIDAGIFYLSQSI